MKPIISKDKKQINLPVALGENVYSFSLQCCDACYFQGDLFYKKYNPKSDHNRCKLLSPCQTIFHGITEKELTLDNMANIIRLWGVQFFASASEAEKAGKTMAKLHQNQMKEMGFNLDEAGRCIEQKT